MSLYQLRVYSLASRESLDFYKDVVYPRHLDGYFPKAGVRAHDGGCLICRQNQSRRATP